MGAAAPPRFTSPESYTPKHRAEGVQGLVLAAVVTFALVGPGGTAAEERGTWSRHLEQAQSAASRGDVASALVALEQAYAAALETGRWESVIEYADAMLDLGDRPGLRRPIAAKARQAYFMALRRARDAGSLEGMVRSAEGFARLRDFEAFAYAALLIQLFEAREPQRP